MPGVNAYSEGVVSRLFKGLTGLITGRGITVIEGRGLLTGPREVTVDGTAYTGEHVVLATGSYAKSLPGLDVDGERVITSDHALRLDRVPASVIVLGGGVIGCEFASVWRSFGAEVTIVEALPRLVALEDEASSKALERAFRKRKITMRTGTPFQSVKTTDDGVAVTVEGGDVIEAELLLVAVGRGPGDRGARVRGAGRAHGPRLRGHRREVPHRASRTCGPWATSSPASSSRTAASSRASSWRRRSPACRPATIDETGDPAGDLLPARGRLGRAHRGAGGGEVRRRRRSTVADLRPRRQRQEPDPQDPGLREAGRGRRTGRSSASTWSATASAS